MKTYNGPANQSDAGNGVAVAPDGNIYVTGSTYVAGQGDNLLLRKYSPTGTVLWTRTHNGASNSSDRGNAVAVAPDGSVYVAGEVGTVHQGMNILLQKYSRAGGLIWTRTYNGPSSRADKANAVAVAPDGNVYVAGETQVSGQEEDFLLQKYSAAGGLTWTRTYNGAANYTDYAEGVAVASDGSVYVTGATYVAGQVRDLLLRKYSPAGGLIWTRTHNGVSLGWDHGFGVAVAPDNSVYVTGYTDVAGQNLNLLLRKYDATGGLRWTRTHNGVSNAIDFGSGVAVGPDGGVHVTGRTYVAGRGYNLLLRKFAGTGASLGTTSYNGAANGDDYGTGIAVAADGSVYVTGSTSVAGQGDNLLLIKYK